MGRGTVHFAKVPYQSMNSTDSNAIVLPLFSGTLFLSMSAVYLNIVFMRTTYKSTLITLSLRKLMRAFASLHIYIAIVIALTSAAISFCSNGSNVLPSSVYVTIVIMTISKEISMTSDLWISIERLLYNTCDRFRDDPHPIMLYLCRIAVILLTVTFPAVMCCMIKMQYEEPGTLYFSHCFFSIYHVLSQLLTIVVLFVVIMLVKRKSHSHKLAGGMKSQTRSARLKEERKLLLAVVIPLALVSIVLTAVETSIYYGKEIDSSVYFHSIIVFIYSLRVAIYPLVTSLFHHDLRDDFKLHFLIWKKAHRRSSEAKVLTIMNRESQDTIITNFKMIGIISDA